MGRMPRIQIENTLYYITSRGDHEQNIFVDKEDYATYIELLKKYKSQYKFKLFAFCLINNHIHLLLELRGGTTISQIMHSLNSTYTKYFNARHQKAGHLFQERYKMVLLEKEPYLLIASAYVHLNPLKLGLVSNIADYPYTNYASYVNGKKNALDMKDEVKEINERLKGRKYNEFITGVQKEAMEALGKELGKKPMLGSDEFTEKVKTIIEAQKMQSKNQAGSQKSNKRFIVIGGSVILLLGLFNVYLYSKTLLFKERLNKEIERQGTEVSKRLGEEKAKIVRDLDEKYRADMVSYEAMTKRFEIEKKRAEELEKKIKSDKAQKI